MHNQLFTLGDAHPHGINPLSQQPQLIIAIKLDLTGVVTSTDASRRFGQLRNRPGKAARQVHCQQRRRIQL